MYFYNQIVTCYFGTYNLRFDVQNIRAKSFMFIHKIKVLVNLALKYNQLKWNIHFKDWIIYCILEYYRS